MKTTLKFSNFSHVLSVALFAIGMLASSSVFAEPPAVVVTRFEEAIDQQIARLAQIPVVEKSSACEARYSRIWAEGRLRIDWYLGYLQSYTDDVVADRLVRYTTVHSLMKPCVAGIGACGFAKIADLTDDDGPIVL
ncbi:MAG: hypothetical protein V4760_18310, partial [Bdellovibrionota bacterium]